MKIPDKWLHIGTDFLDKNKFKKIKNDAVLPKPYGGIWASPLALEGKNVSDWHGYFKSITGKSLNSPAVIFDFVKHTRFYVIDNQEDLIQLINKVGFVKSSIPYLQSTSIDFEEATKHYDVIYLTSQGQIETRFPFENRDYNLYGWDVESCIILNPNVIKSQLKVRV